MSLPFASDNGQPHSFSGTQGLLGAHANLISDAQTLMEAGLGAVGGSQQQSSTFNMALLCRIGQETVQEIVGKTTELFQTLKTLQPPSGAAAAVGGQEDRKGKLQDNLKYIALCFRQLRRIYDKCNENCASLEYTHIEVDSLVPLKDEMDSRTEDRKSSENVQYVTEEHMELVEQVMLKNRQLKEVIDSLRIFIWDINTMLAVRKP